MARLNCERGKEDGLLRGWVGGCGEICEREKKSDGKGESKTSSSNSVADLIMEAGPEPSKANET